MGVRPVVQRDFPLARAADAHRHSETGRTRGKLVLVVDPRLADLRPAGARPSDPAARPSDPAAGPAPAVA